jgi:FMN reductase
MDSHHVLTVALDGSPGGHGHTDEVLHSVLTGVNGGGSDTSLASLSEVGVPRAIELVDQADALVLGTPVYRASFAYTVKALLDSMPRGLYGENSAPLRGKGVVIVATGASLHHFLAVDDLRNVLATFFAAHVVPPGLYVSREDFGEDGQLLPVVEERARQQGRALAELTVALAQSETLCQLLPQA